MTSDPPAPPGPPGSPNGPTGMPPGSPQPGIPAPFGAPAPSPGMPAGPPGIPAGPPGIPAGPPHGGRKRDPLPFIVTGVIVAVLAGVCCLGGALILFERRTSPHPVRTPSPPAPANSGEPMPSPGPSGSPGGDTPLTGAACLIGVWRETSHTSTATVDGNTFQVRSTGAVQRFTADGTAVLDMSAGVAETGTSGGATYQIISKGTITFHYRTEPGVIFYSDPVGTGTVVWKRNGKQFDSQPIRGAIAPEFFSCAGDKLTENTGDYAIELRRVTG